MVAQIMSISLIYAHIQRAIIH